MKSPFEILGLPETARPDRIKIRWRELAKAHHPDYGGNAKTFNEFHVAYKAAYASANLPRSCETCSGQGRITKQSGFSTTRLTCPVCRGSGHRGG